MSTISGTTGGSTNVVLNPWDGSRLDERRWDSSARVEEILARSTQGRILAAAWTAAERAALLNRVADQTEAAGETLARLITAESGKTIRDSRLEIVRMVLTLRSSAEESRRLHGEILDGDAWGAARGKNGHVFWRPVGTVLAITPFNFPLNIAAHKVGPALAAGNAVLLKPSPRNILSTEAWVAICHAAGIPESVLQLALPDIAGVSAMVADPRVHCINFTGGVGTGQAIAHTAGCKKLLMELGGNDPLIVMPDADLDLAAATTVAQRFGTAGQRCTAAKRLFVHSDVFEAFKQKLLARTVSLNVGDPSHEETDVGPLIDSHSADTVMAVINAALRDGATLLAGNRRVGNLVYPTVLEGVPDQATLVCQETFGPVVPLRRFETIAEVIESVNSGEFGLQAGIFTRDLMLVKDLFEKLEVGALAVNDGPGFRAEHFPFGGVKLSGLGREGTGYAAREMSIQKLLIL